MIIALIDYLYYRKNAGPYASKNWPGLLRNAFKSNLPQIAVDNLRAGDLILVGSMSSFTSWTVMYLSGAPISHIAISTGSNTIIHATTGGVIESDISSLYGRNNLLLPLIAPFEGSMRGAAAVGARSCLGRPYGWRDVRQKAVWRLTARDWVNFRFVFYLDVVLVLLVIGLLISLVFGTSLLLGLWLVTLYSLLIVFGYILHRFRPLPYELAASPVDFFRVARQDGFRAMLCAQPQGPGDTLTAISTDLYVFAKAIRLPNPTTWMRSIAADVTPVPACDIQHLTLGQVGTITLAETILRVSVRAATSEIRRLDLDYDFGDIDLAIRIDYEPDLNATITAVRAVSSLARLSYGVIYNPSPAHEFIGNDLVLEWSEGVIASLRDLIST